jgi:capsular exopolysaccharide synthesis family protein
MAKSDFTNPPTSSPEDNHQLISLLDIFSIVRKRFLLGGGIGLLFAALFAFAILSKEKMYEAEASITVELSTDNVMDIGEVVNTRVANINLLNTFMNTNVERLTGRSMAEAVIESLSEEEQDLLVEAYVGPLSERSADESPLDVPKLLIKYALNVERGAEDESQVIRIVITHPTPAIAQAVANAYVKQYIIFNADLRENSTAQAVAFLDKQAIVMRVELEQAETELQDFRQANNLVTVQQDQGVIVQRLTRISGAVSDAQLRLLEAGTRMDQIKEAGGNIDLIMEIPFVGSRKDIADIYSQLSELKRERLVLDETYLRRHPKVVNNTASQESVSAALQRAVTQACKQVESEYNAINTELSNLLQKLEQAEGDVLTAERALLEYRRIERSVLKQRDMLDAVLTRYNQTSIAKEMNLNNVRLLSQAQLPVTPTNPSIIQVAAASVFIAGIFLVGVPLGVELLDNRLSSFADIESYSNKQLLGDVRFIPQKGFREMSNAVLTKDRDLIESFRSIYSALRLRTNLSKEKITYVVTSSLAGEGKSTVASNLASTISTHDYSVLLIDCDLRRPTLHDIFKLKNDQGVVKWHESNQSVDEDAEILTDQALGIVELIPNLYLLRSGGSSEHPTEILGDRKMEGLFDRLKEEFDVIIIDTPPVGLFPDATLIGDFADGCIFVARQFKVTRQKMRFSINTMDRSNASVIGVIFNAIKDASSAIGYANTGRNNYGDGYEKDTKRYKDYYRKGS